MAYTAIQKERLSLGLCIWCKKPRGQLGTKNYCRSCADKVKASSIRWHKRTYEPSLPPFKTRFWRRVKKTRRCWIWIGTKTGEGYGQLKVNKERWLAHRLSFVFAAGSIPEGMHVLHRCDTPACVNPKHLFIGTHQDNMRDRDAKGRNLGLQVIQRKRASRS